MTCQAQTRWCHRAGEVAGVGVEFVVLDADGRIRPDYQFIEG